MSIATKVSNLTSVRFIRPLSAIIAISVCLLLIWTTGRLALSKLLLHIAMESASVVAARASVQLRPTDAEARMVHGLLLKASGELNASITELEQAVALRPRDYYLWLELGLARDQVNDNNGALAAFNEAVRLAPFYANPRWQRGNLELRNRRYEEAFSDLRTATTSNPERLPNLIDLSWSLSQGDVRVIEELAEINTPHKRLAFARFLVSKGNPREALEQIHAAGKLSDENRKELIALLISKKAFHEAFELWTGERSGPTEAGFYDGGFETPLSLDESGFGWRVARSSQGANLSFDDHEPNTGKRSLQIVFTGDSNPDSTVVSQLLLVQPSTKYLVSFAVRTRELVTGGLPFAKVTNAEGGEVLGMSTPLQETSGWQPITFTFTTGSTNTGVVLSLQRMNCGSSPCPAFGTIWLDSFGIQLAE